MPMMGHLAVTGLHTERGSSWAQRNHHFVPVPSSSMTPTHFAYRITVEQGPEVREYIGAGTSLLDATARAAHRLEAMSGPEASLIAISRLGPALVRGTLPHAPPRPPAKAATKPSPPVTKPTPMGAPAVKTAKTPRTAKTKKTAKPTGMTRVEQLVALLQERGGQAHLDQIAKALDTGKQNAQNVIAAGAKQGLVRRLGQRTGEVALVQAEAPSPQPAEPQVASTVRSGPTRAEQLVALLREHDGQMHIHEIGTGLGLDLVNVQNTVASAAKKGWVKRVGQRTGIVVLIEAQVTKAKQVEAEPAKPKPSKKKKPKAIPAKTSASTRTKRGRTTRVQQLLDVLRAQGGEAHTDLLAREIGTSVPHTRNCIMVAIKRGLVRRVGQGTGVVALVEMAPPATASAPANVLKGTRAEQVVAALQQAGGEGHLAQIAEALGTSAANAKNAIVAALKQGGVERVGSRTGRVRLLEPSVEAKEPPAQREAPPAAQEQPSVDPVTLEGMQKRVFAALQEFGAAVTAKEIASKLGCRPREAGNALVLLVDAKLVVRGAGEGKARYRVT